MSTDPSKTEEDDDSFNATNISFLKEKEAVLAIIKEICSDDEEQFSVRFDTLSKILVTYQEQCHLLNPYIHELMYHPSVLLQKSAENNNEDNSSRLHQVCKVIQLFCRIRGGKYIIKHFPNEVKYLEPCLQLVLQQDRNDHETWETRYSLLLWLGVLCTVPFDICSIDSKLGAQEVPGGRAAGSSFLVTDITSVCRQYLSDPGPVREAASLCLSSLLTRPDMDAGCLGDFLRWSVTVLRSWTESHSAVSGPVATGSDSFQVVGVLYCLALIFKRGHRNRLLTFAAMLLDQCLALCGSSSRSIGKKLLCKLLQRIALTFLPPRTAEWRYTIGRRSLGSHMATAAKVTEAAVVRDRVAAAGGSDDAVPHELEGILESVLCFLGDKDTVVRWSAAKGVGRITMLLPRAFADDIVGAVIDLFSDRDADSCWHGGCLALAELARRGLLLPERLAEVVPHIERAIVFDVVRGQHSVGAHVRDAACYVCWSFSRAYSPVIMRPFSPQLSAAMLVTAVFDREVNCRRAASAAFQENVGRQGNDNYPHGIDIITVADFFSVGNRANAYLVVAPAVAAMSADINCSFLRHLCSVKCFHWDLEVRQLASKAVAKLAVLDLDLAVRSLGQLVCCCTAPLLHVRHGAILATAELLLALSMAAAEIPPDLVTEVGGVAGAVEKARLYRGRGGEQVRQAICLLIGNIARSCVAISPKTQVSFVECLNEHIRQPFEALQVAAGDALRQVLFAYFSRSSEAPSEKLQALTTRRYLVGLATDDNVAVTRGYARALGMLPARLVLLPEGTLSAVVAGLDEASRANKLICGEYDAATSSNAVGSLAELAERLCDQGGLEPPVLARCFDVFWRACTDYSVDKRGDTGSWTRIAGLIGIERMIHAARRRERFTGTSVVSSPRGLEGCWLLTSAGLAAVTAVDKARVTLSADNSDELGTWSAVLTVTSPPLVMDSCSSDGSSQALQLPPAVHSLHGDVIVRSGGAVRLRVHFDGSSDCTGRSDWLSARVVQQSVSCVLKQLSEKLDSVREVAGQVFLRLVLSGIPLAGGDAQAVGAALARVPMDDGLVVTSACPAPRKDYRHINWARPDHAFAVVCSLMTSAAFLRPVLAGIVLSVGGLTATTAAAASESLRAACVAMQSQPWFRTELALGMLDLFHEYRNCDRVLCPLMKTLDFLLRGAAFDLCADLELRVETGHSSAEGRMSLSKQLLLVTSAQLKGCSNVPKLCQSMDLLQLLLAEAGGLVRRVALKLLVKNLCHKYPKIRKHVAEMLYVQFLSDRVVVGPPRLASATGACGLCRSQEDAERALELLSVTPWDKGDAGMLRERRGALFVLCGLDAPDPEELALLGAAVTLEGAAQRTGRAPAEAKVDELDSYDALVREAGY